ncbi:MAG: alpha/beta fold hydrolase [Myxococcales bacterium]|nr:alpha/beta fold hydrolase [Myxococcales bacterium]
MMAARPRSVAFGGLLLLISAFGMPGCLAHHVGPLPGAPDGRYLQVQDARIRVDDRGQGPAVVLIHGFASALDAWDTVVPALESHHRVIRLDLKGFGWSDRPEGDYSPDAQAQLVLGVMDQLGVSSAAVVGHSWGASVALALALRAPERVSRLALYDAWAYSEQLPTFFWWARADGFGDALFWLFYEQRTEDRMAMAFHDPRFVTQELIDAVDAALERPGTLAASLAAARDQRYEEVQHRYRTIVTPTLLVWGREDLVSPLWVGERLARELPNARLVSYGDCGHFPMIEARHASNRDLIEFLTDGSSPVSGR